MPRTIVNPKTLDALIRAKLASLGTCLQVEPLPVTWNDQRNGGCNWQVPGWVGDAGVVSACLEQLEHYLEFLREQFDIPPQGAGD